MTDTETLRQRAQVLGTLADQHPVWIELLRILEEDVDISENALCVAAMSDSERAYQAGYLAHVLDLRQNLVTWRAAGRKPAE